MTPETDRPSNDAAKLLAQIDAHVPFGPLFFLTQLGAFVRDRCPDPGEALPLVEVHLEHGEILHLCHIIGVAPHWVALAVREGRDGAMRTELVPYCAIVRVTVRSVHADGAHIGFDQAHAPTLLAEATQEPPIDTLRAAAVSEKH